MKLLTSKSFYEFYLEKIFIGTLLFYFINSFLIKYFRFSHIVGLALPALGIFKIILFLFFLIILIINFKKRQQFLFYGGFLFLVVIVGEINWDIFINSGCYSYQCFLKTNFFNLVKYLYPFFFIGVFSLIKKKQESISRYFDILEKLLIINVFFVFLGFIFSIDFFQSYLHSNRFGMSGLIEPGFFEYLLMITISRSLFLGKLNCKFFIFCLASLFIGTKAVFLFFVILIFYYLYEKKKSKLLLFYSVFLFLSLVFLKSILNFFAFYFPFWQPLLNKYGIMTVVTSTRNWNVQNTIEFAKMNGTVKNFFVGGGELSKQYVEMDTIDLFLFFGIIGGIVYLLFLSKIINKKYHLIPFIVGFFAIDFMLSTIVVSTCFIWIYESYTQKKGGILN